MYDLVNKFICKKFTIFFYKKDLQTFLPYAKIYLIEKTNPCIVRVDWNFRTNKFEKGICL